MTAFYIDTSNKFSSKQQLRCWQLLVPWLAERADHYQILCEPQKAGSPQIVSLLSKHASLKKEVEKKVRSRLLGALLKSVSKGYPTGMLSFEGTPDRTLSDILVQGSLPDESVSADIAPCREVMFFRNKALLFSSYDYGRFSSFFVTEEEINKLRSLLEKSALPQDMLREQRGDLPGNTAWFFAGKIKSK